VRYWTLWLLIAALVMVVAILARHAGVFEAFIDGVIFATPLVLIFRLRDRLVQRGWNLP
jgi:hypothetical protein